MEHRFATNLSNSIARINNCSKLITLHRFSSSSLIDNAMSLTYCTKIYYLVPLGRKIPLTSPNLFLLLWLGIYSFQQEKKIGTNKHPYRTPLSILKIAFVMLPLTETIFSILEYEPYNYNKICRREHSLYSHAHATNISCTPWPNPIWELDQKLVWTFNPIYNLLSCATTLAPTPFIIHTPQKIT